MILISQFAILFVNILLGTTVPVVIENDANGAVAAELLCNDLVDEDAESVAMITLGTGVGCGIIINGKILHGGKGATGYAPEFGHAVIEVSALCIFCCSCTDFRLIVS